MKKNIVLLTGSELRHEFFRKYLSDENEINVLASYCESNDGNLNEIVENDQIDNSFRLEHLSSRSITEFDFFGLYCKTITDKSNPIFIEKGEINNLDIVNHIINLKPDLIISYGCSIIKSELIKSFENRFINIHLGLSPYYRGSGTNFWPFVNSELQFVGTTFMHINSGIDTGEIIHQIRANINFNDNIHQIGNRLIRDSFSECILLIKYFDKLKKLEPLLSDKSTERYYRKKDFTEESLKIAYRNISNGLINKYLDDKNNLDLQFPIITNSIR